MYGCRYVIDASNILNIRNAYAGIHVHFEKKYARFEHFAALPSRRESRPAEGETHLHTMHSSVMKVSFSKLRGRVVDHGQTRRLLMSIVFRLSSDLYSNHA